MALAPCDVCHRRYRGPATFVYVALLNGTWSSRRRLRLDQRCFAEVEQDIEAGFQLIGTGPDLENYPEFALQDCSFCPTKQVPWVGFVDAYPKGEPERHYAVALCDAHLGLALYDRTGIGEKGV